MRPFSLIIAGLAAIAMLGGLGGCGDSTRDKASPYGAVMAQVVWPNQAQPAALSRPDGPMRWVVPAGVTTIKGFITATDIDTPPETTIAVTEGDSGTGTIGNVPIGSDRTLTVQGLDAAGDVIYEGITTGITVNAGETTDAGPVELVEVTDGGGGTGETTAVHYGDQLPLYDDFETNTIDRTHWGNSDIVREFVLGKLIIQIGEPNLLPGVPQNNDVVFANPDGIQSLETIATVVTHETDGESYRTRAHIGGSFYNDGRADTEAGSMVGDILAEIAMSSTEAFFLVYRCDEFAFRLLEFNPYCVTSTLLTTNPDTQEPGRVLLDLVTIGDTHTLYMDWDGSVFTFQFDLDDPVTFDPVAAGAPIASETPNLPHKFIGADVGMAPNVEGYLKASFDEVSTNGAIFDDFDGSSMDSTKWVNGEIVVEVRNKQLVVNLELVGQMENIGLIFNDPDVIDAISADFNVLSRESDTLFTFGEIYGTYYNDGSEGSAPGSFLGDVVAVFALLDDVAAYAVWKCQSKNCETLEFLSIDPLTQLPGAALLSFVDSNVAHRPFVQWDGAVFTFQIDDKPPVVFDPVAAGAPIAGAPNFPVKYVGARAQLLSGESGAISLTIDNVRAGSAIDIPTE